MEIKVLYFLKTAIFLLFCASNKLNVTDTWKEVSVVEGWSVLQHCSK